MKLEKLNLLEKNQILWTAYPWIFSSNGKQDVDGGHSDKISSDTKTPVVNKLDRCAIKPVSLSNIFQKTKVLKKPNDIIQYESKVYFCQSRIISFR